MSISDWLESQNKYYAPPGVTIYNKGYEDSESRKNKIIIGVVVSLIAIGLGVGLYFVLSPKSTDEKDEDKKRVRFNTMPMSGLML
jgi:hypothetical protein